MQGKLHTSRVFGREVISSDVADQYKNHATDARLRGKKVAYAQKSPHDFRRVQSTRSPLEMSNAVAKLLPTHDNSLHRFPGANDSAIMPIMTCSVAWEGRGCGFSTAIRPAYGRDRIPCSSNAQAVDAVSPTAHRYRGDVLSDHVRERSARQRADGLGCQGDDALHRADLPEQPFRGR